MAYVRLPNDSYFPIAEGETPDQALQAAQQKYPRAFLTEKELEERQGFTAATKEAFKRAKAGSFEAAGKLFGSDTLKQLAEQERKELEEQPGFLPTTEGDREAAFKKGLLSGIGALGREYISEPVGGIVGRYGVPLAIGAGVTAAAPAVGIGGFGATVAGGAATALADYLPQVGENIERQRDVGQPENLQSAALSGIPQAALSGLNLRLGMLPKPIQNLFRADAAALEKQVLAGALKPEEAIAKLSGNLKNILLSTGSAAVVGAGTMGAEEAFRRQQAGQSLTDEEALGEYADIGKGALALAPLFGVPRGAFKRGAERRGIERAGQEFTAAEGIKTRAREDAEAAAAADLKQADELRARQAETGDLFGEPIRTEGPAKGKQAFGKMEGDVSPFIPSEEAQLKAGRTYDQRTVAERERAAQEQAVETQTPFEAARQRDLLAQRVEEIESRIAEAAAKGDVDTVTSLTGQRAQARTALKEAETAVKAAGPMEVRPEDQFKQLNEQYQARIKELQKAGDLGDFDKISKLSEQIKGLQEQLQKAKDTGPDLFAVEKEAVAKGRAEADEALARGQQDLLAQLKQPETRVDAAQRKVLDRYQDSVRQLDEAYAANADKRIIDQLVDKVQADAAERAAIIAKTSDTRTLAQEEAGQQRIARITRAIAEAEAKQDTGSVAGLRNQLAKAIVDTARPQVENRRSRALEDQMAAAEQVRSAIEDLRSGRYLGEGTKDPSMAASLKSGVERQANEAVGRYVEAAIRDVQALREQNGQKKMTVTEATRMAMDLRGHLEKAVKNQNTAAFAIPKGDLALDRSRKIGEAPQKKPQPTLVQRGAVSPIERQLAQIKKKYHAGEPIEVRRGEKTLRRDILRKEPLRQEVEPKERKKGEEGTPYETPERKAERLEQEKIEAVAQKRMAQDAGNADQLGLFTPKELKPIATVRATPENFQRLLRSGAVQKLKAEAEALARPMAAVTAARKATGSVTVNKDNLRTSVAIQERFANEVKNAQKTAKELEKEIAESRALAQTAKETLDKTRVPETNWPADFGVYQEQALIPIRKNYEKLLKNVAEKEDALARFKKDYAEHLDTSVSVERAILKELERNLEKAVEGSPEQRRIKAQADASRAREAVLERNIKEMAEEAAATTRKAEEASAKRLGELPVTKQEIVETTFKTPGSEERVLRKQVTRETRSAEEKRQKQIERQKAARDEIAQRAEPKRQRQKVAEALKQESELKKQLKTLQDEQGKLFGKKEAIEKRLEKTRSETVIERLKADLKDTKAQIKKADFEKREQSLKTQLADLSTVGAKVERVLTVAGDKPAREQKQKPLRVGKTVAEKYDLKKLFGEQLEEVEATYKQQIQNKVKGRSGIDYRVEVPATGERLDSATGKRVAETVEKNLPKDIRVSSVESFAELPEKVKAQMVRDGITEGSPQAAVVRGFVTPEGDVYVIRGNHTSVKDMERTYVHEIIGHAGVDRVLGKAGVDALVKRIDAQGGALELARKLGIEEQVKGALEDYALVIKKMTDANASKEAIDKAMREMETQAVRELIAYTAEKRVDETFKQKAGRWIKEIVGAVREALRKMGFAELSKVSTSDIYSILRESQQRYNKGELGAFRDMNGNMSYRNKPVFNPNIDPAEAATVGKVIAQDKPIKDRIKGSAMGMSFMHRFVDRFAGLDYIARNMRDKLEGLQMMYYNRLYDQRNNMISEIATHGSVGLEKNTDGTYQYKSRKGPSLKTVFESVNKAKSEFGNAQATLDYFGTYLAMERAASNKGGLKAGLEKLDLSGKISEVEANAILKKGRGNTNFQEARKAYRTYNDGMIDLMIESGRLSKEQGAELKKGDYVPYYRDKGGVIIDTENSIRVGDLKTQAYLKELMGGDSAIVNFETGALQNTYMLTDMAMSNIASKNTAYTLNKLDMADVKPGSGPAKANIIRFYENGKEMHAEISTRGSYEGLEARLDKMREAGKANTPEYKKLREKAEASRASEGAFGDIPAELIVKGMEGVASVMPAGVSMMRGPADLLRKAVTRNPAYALRVAFKDSISGWVTSGADMTPIISTLGSLKKSLKGSDEIRALQEQGVIGGHVFAGTLSDMRTIAQQIAQGQSGWEKLWAKADRMAMMADEAQRVTLYNGFIKKGMSPMEASLATLESQNFTKHGYSPTIKALSTMIPFFNAQIQGLNSFGRAITGTSLFQDKAGVREQMLKRGMILAATTLGYTALMQNNEAYQNATEIDKLNHWFIPLPFMDEPLRVPIPFETGLVFKALPEAIYNLMATDAKSKDVLPAFGRQVLNSIPGMSNLFLPQGIKPVVELATGTNLFTMQDIESTRQKAELAGYRSGANTTEVSKALGKAIGVSPVQLDHAVNAYTSGLGIALLSMFNPMLRDVDTPEGKASQMPILGGFFQPTDAGGLIDKAYKDVDQIEKVNRTFKQLEESNPDEAERFLDKYLTTLDMASAAGKFKKEMGDINKEERLIRSDREMTSAQKRAELDELKQLKIELAKEFMSISRE
jgi:hypothetical protein